ncbi:hypothetical protein LSAT2_012384, partial [Lamellibrachia satsuma]
VIGDIEAEQKLSLRH